MIAKLIRQGRKLVKVLVHSDYRRALWKGRVAAGMEHERLLRSLNCATVVDIGANRGQFALVARHCLPAARIISFEPLAAPAACFRAVLGHDPLIALHQVAIGPVATEAIIHVAAEDDSSSLLPMTALQKSMYSGMNEVGTETIRVETLAQRVTAEDLRSPALLKIDVQGYELSTLQGCAALLRKFAFAYVECSFVELYAGQALAHEVIAYMSEQGFKLQGVYNLSSDDAGRAIQADLLFAP
jgi:FkbM family methyltransferase